MFLLYKKLEFFNVLTNQISHTKKQQIIWAKKQKKLKLRWCKNSAKLARDYGTLWNNFLNELIFKITLNWSKVKETL